MTKPEKPENTAMGAGKHPLLAWLCLTCCGRTWAVPSVACPDVQQGTLQVNLGQLGVKSVCFFMFFFPERRFVAGFSEDYRRIVSCLAISIIPHTSFQYVSRPHVCVQYVSSQLYCRSRNGNACKIIMCHFISLQLGGNGNES